MAYTVCPVPTVSYSSLHFSLNSSNLLFYQLNIFYNIPDTFLCRREKLFGIEWTANLVPQKPGKSALVKRLNEQQQESVGLSTSCSRFSKKFPVISQKVASKLLKNQLKIAFCDEVLSKAARKNKTFFWSDAKVYKLYNKSKISKLF